MAIEACCGAADLAEELVTERNQTVLMAHPGYVSRMKRSPDKTDLGDAQLLADLVRVNYLPRVWLAPKATRELRRLIRYRANAVKQRTNIKLRIRGLLRENRLKCKDANAWSKAWIVWLRETADLSDSDRWIVERHLAELAFQNQNIAATEARLRQAIQDDPLVEKLLSLYGVGLVTAVTIRAEVGRFDRFDTGKQLARFCGVTPRNASSGAKQADAGLIRAGNPALRQVLIELAHRLVSRGSTRWNQVARQLLNRGKPRNVVVAAIANRWTRWLHHEMKRPIENTAQKNTNQKKSTKTEAKKENDLG
jgi:transposase